MGSEKTIKQNEFIAGAYDRIYLLVKKGKKLEYQLAANRAGLSLNAFIVQAINKMMEVE